MSIYYVFVGTKITRKLVTEATLGTDAEIFVREEGGKEFALVVDGNYLWIHDTPERTTAAKYGRNDPTPCLEWLEDRFDVEIFDEYDPRFENHLEGTDITVLEF